MSSISGEQTKSDLCGTTKKHVSTSPASAQKSGPFFLKRTTYTGIHMVYRLYILIKIELVTSVVEHYSCWHVFIKPNCSGMDSEWKSRVSFHIIFKVVLNHNNLTTPSIRTTLVRFDKSVICPWWRASVLYNLYDKSSQMSYNKPIKIPLETVMCTF